MSEENPRRNKGQVHYDFVFFFPGAVLFKAIVGMFVSSLCFSGPDLEISGKHAVLCKCVQIENMPIIASADSLHMHQGRWQNAIMQPGMIRFNT